MTYTILPGKHYSRPWRPRVYIGCKRWQWTCKFIDVRHKPDGSTHKLVGVGFGLNHDRNSIRVGWRYRSDADMVELYAYSYKDGKREDFIYLCAVEQGKDFSVEIKYMPEVKMYHLRIESKGLGSNTAIDIPYKWFAYGLGFFYGGSLPSPNLIKAEIR